jgi:chromosome segregation protein
VTAPSGPGRLLAPSRLLALRLQGFKSFAERTSVEFGGGISAIVGPNGSGKSNLADALRWALGEQGRALRSRKAEDVIWAGSDKRAAQGMADVTLVIDNADGLLPVDFQVLELGRRLYRSGENDYLLNKQRIRLRDLVELLDAAHLADNAFLFIGQGMVDQALALRPEERRPLFEEVAGVRRHERRRRRAQEQLVESEANLARVEDIVAELRPQARRLAAQAEQQTSRQTTADELAAAILLSAHARWHEAAARVGETQARRAAAGADADRAMADMTAAEAAASGVAAELGARAVAERERREAHDAARARLTAAQLGEARVASEIGAIERDRTRIAADRTAAEAELAAGRRSGAAPVPPRDVDLEAALAEAERETAAALAELGALRAERQAQGEELAALRRAATARQAELETARRRADEAARQAAGEGERATAAAARRDATAALATAAHDRRAAAIEAERAATAAMEVARAALESAEAERSAAEARAVAAEADLATVQGRARSLETRLAEEEGRGIAKAARRHGGRRVDEELLVDPGLRAAVEAALGEATRAYLVKVSAVTDLAGERGALIVEERASATAPAADARERRFLDAVSGAGGGLLADAVQRDGNGAARRLLARAAWVPDLAACLAVQAGLPGGWIVVPRDGSAVVGELAVAFGAGESVLQRRAQATALGAEAERLAAAASSARAAAVRASTAADAARTALEAARTAESRAATDRRTADDAERLAARDAEAAVREAAWAEAQADRLRNDQARAAAALAAMDTTADPSGSVKDGGTTPTEAATSAIEAWEARAAEMRARRDRLAEQAASADAARREAEARRTRAETGIALAEERMARADRELEGLDARGRDLAAERDRLRSDLATVVVAEAAARQALADLHAADAADRERLATAEQGASSARERLRGADDRLRTADRAELETRLGLDALRESVLVDLAGLGEPGLAHLAAVSGMTFAASTNSAVDPDPDTDADATAEADVDAGGDTAAFESALDAAADRWAAAPPTDAPPGPARLGQLRRRFHELGAVNPYAVDEYAELKTRLETLETQATDLRTAIVRTRELIAELETLIADQFQTTFRALEVAFASRFEQLFGGGFARISLTDPSDLGSTGVEIVARPPGKKAQALAMLSGGERALTAVALLFAMLEVRPVPFCVLDEVDAALDEANVGRFADALRSLAHQTQFVVITHNRGTIEAADALYGVTVGDDSVSRVISLRLDEAQALADQGRSEPVPTR